MSRVFKSSLVFVFLYPTFLFGQVDDGVKKQSLFDFLSDQASLRITLNYGMDSLLEFRMQPHVYRGEFTAYNGDSLLLSIPVKVSPRGKFRRKKCDYPPLKLDFPKGQLKDLGFSKADQYKLVTHCLKSRVGQRVLAKEYLVYQMFGLLTDASYRTKLFDIRYEDSSSGEVVESIAFMIESNKELADRHDGKWCNCMGSSAHDIDPDRHELIALFQFMIGNRDMDVKTEHNVRFLERKGKKLFPFPYDYDFSIFVKAPYAYVSTLNFQPRLYLGFEENEHLIPDLKKKFMDLRKPFYDLIRENEYLNKADRKWCLKYIKSFYSRISKKNFQPPYPRPSATF